MDIFTKQPRQAAPLPGKDYIQTLHKYLKTNFPRLAPTAPPSATLLQQSYTLLTLGLDPSSQPLSSSLKVPLTLGFGQPGQAKGPIKPVLLRLPPDRLLYLLLRWQALPQQPPHVGRTDVPIEDGVPYTARGATERGAVDRGDVQSVRSWVGSMRSVSMQSMGWFAKEQVSEDQLLLELYSMFTVLPALLIHPPFYSDPPIADLVEVGGYTQLGGIDVRVPMDVLRNLQILELEGYDPRALLIPPNPNLRSLTIRDVQDGDDWLEDLLGDSRFPHLRHLSLLRTTLLSFPTLKLSRLTSLDLSHNLLNDIPPALSSLSSLVSLNLSHNLIVSVRSAPSALGYITSLNLSHNRIDCLVGLERVLGLERVDVRHNELEEYEEVGRLAVLPHIKEVWCALEGDGWRVKLGTTFALEGREVVIDDTPFTWSERKNIDAELAARGKRRPRHDRQPTTPAVPPAHISPATSVRNTSGISPLPQRALGFNANSTPGAYRDALGQGLGKASGSGSGTGNGNGNGSVQPNNGSSSRNGGPKHEQGHETAASSRPRPPSIHTTVPAEVTPSARSPAPSLAKQKRRPRRVINLDSNEGMDSVKGGSMRLPPKSVMPGEDGVGGLGREGLDAGDGAGAGADADAQGIPKRTGGRRARVSASLFEPH